ncbi:TNT domain-containing protein [Streptomyces sp. H27-D2]|uniref:TNT domain-containing protein n=1 Tax=Streptomyces sp. H27-D2 TaxID=3046304 RepID=UPI002DBCD8AF|nr:TNT domain-containing protein [Streptomyces sp. H27-D2]MEC4018649.1 TNT domain-containing protein [Streptomyces sp. H27-D2]
MAMSGAVLAGSLLAGTAQAAPPDEAAAATVRASDAGQDRTACSGKYQGDERLGPESLPPRWEKPVGPLLAHYRRTGALTPPAFLAKYWDEAKGSWKYPPNDGFLVKPNGEVDKRRAKLRVGQDLDRFGSEYGSFLAPAGDRYARRALPPQSLSTREAAFPCNYHAYEVTRPFSVWKGRIAAWFEQPGGGKQVLLDAKFLDPGEGQALNVKWLLAHNYLKPDDDRSAATGQLAATGVR